MNITDLKVCFISDERKVPEINKVMVLGKK